MKLYILGTAALLAGCAVPMQITGNMQDSPETFAGTVIDNVTPSGGTIELVSSEGATCKGTHTMLDMDNRRGVMTCSDGRAGTYELTSAGWTGQGTGVLANRRMVFQFSLKK